MEVGRPGLPVLLGVRKVFKVMGTGCVLAIHHTSHILTPVGSEFRSPLWSTVENFGLEFAEQIVTNHSPRF